MKPTFLGPGLAILTTLTFTIGVIWYGVTQLFHAQAPQPLIQATRLQPQQPPVALTTVNQFTISHLQWQVKGPIPHLVGRIQNQSSRSYAYVKLEFELYDAAGKRLGEQMAIVSNLKRKQTEAFETPVIFRQATTARIKAVTGF